MKTDVIWTSWTLPNFSTTVREPAFSVHEKLERLCNGDEIRYETKKEEKIEVCYSSSVVSPTTALAINGSIKST